MKEHKLFIVGTPIGNFDDITFRALDILKKVDVIACEDTRVTLKLLNHFDIKNKKLISYHNFNEKNSAKGSIDLILNKNLSVALVSDAGMPTISDPGFNLIEEARKQKINFVVIPGVSATTTAICASNLGSEFTFLGFGKAKKKQKTTDRGRSFNIVRIFTRYGQYTDIDNPVNPKTGSGIGGRNGLNTEAFAYHKNGKYKGKTLAMDSSPVIAPVLGATTLENPSKTQWRPKDEDKIADILGNGIVKDMAKFLEDALK